jgi:hypothetical protein
MLSSANFSETGIPVLSTYLKGPYTDFTSDWYKDIGTSMVKTMLIGSLFPLIEAAGNCGIKIGLRLFDRSFGKDAFKSKKKSI